MDAVGVPQSGQVAGGLDQRRISRESGRAD
jgi:hypothetical protein